MKDKKILLWWVEDEKPLEYLKTTLSEVIKQEWINIEVSRDFSLAIIKAEEFSRTGRMVDIALIDSKLKKGRAEDVERAFNILKNRFPLSEDIIQGYKSADKIDSGGFYVYFMPFKSHERVIYTAYTDVRDKWREAESLGIVNIKDVNAMFGIEGKLNYKELEGYRIEAKLYKMENLDKPEYVELDENKILALLNGYDISLNGVEVRLWQSVKNKGNLVTLCLAPVNEAEVIRLELAEKRFHFWYKIFDKVSKRIIQQQDISIESLLQVLEKISSGSDGVDSEIEGSGWRFCNLFPHIALAWEKGDKKNLEELHEYLLENYNKEEVLAEYVNLGLYEHVVHGYSHSYNFAVPLYPTKSIQELEKDEEVSLRAEISKKLTNLLKDLISNVEDLKNLDNWSRFREKNLRVEIDLTTNEPKEAIEKLKIFEKISKLVKKGEIKILKLFLPFNKVKDDINYIITELEQDKPGKYKWRRDKLTILIVPSKGRYSSICRGEWKISYYRCFFIVDMIPERTSGTLALGRLFFERGRHVPRGTIPDFMRFFIANKDGILLNPVRAWLEDPRTVEQVYFSEGEIKLILARDKNGAKIIITENEWINLEKDHLYLIFTGKTVYQERRS